MRGFLKENGYLAVMGVCLVCSAVLLVSVLTDRPLVAMAVPHLPVLRVEAAREAPAAAEGTGEEQSVLSDLSSGFLLTEAFLEERLEGFLPDSFPVEDVDVSFEGGLVRLSFAMERTGLKTYLAGRGAELGTKRSLLLQMLPRQLELEGSFALSADENGAHLTPVSMQVGEKAFSLSGLPADTFSAIDSGLNALLENAGVHFSSAEFTDGGILLK